MEKETTHFGFQQIPVNEKAHKVAEVFTSVASRYDLMNDLMSFGIHRLWKKIALQYARVQPGNKVLDIAGGTGDLTAQFAKRVGPQGKVVLADINAAMLNVGRSKLLNHGFAAPIVYAQADAQMLPFADNSFDCISIAFGLRNVTNKMQALRSMTRVLKPGGRLLILEFSKPTHAWFNHLYDQYSFKVLPLLGQFIAKDADSYRYLAESIRMHPDQITLANMMQEANLTSVEYFNMTGGIVALHQGIKP